MRNASAGKLRGSAYTGPRFSPRTYDRRFRWGVRGIFEYRFEFSDYNETVTIIAIIAIHA